MRSTAWAEACRLTRLLLWGAATVMAHCSEAPPAACDPRCPSANPDCHAFQTCCGGQWVLLSTDAAHCGGCGVTCPSGVCAAGQCVSGNAPRPSVPTMAAPDAGADAGPGVVVDECTPLCAANQRCCGGSCFGRSVAPDADGRSDGSFAHCGGCRLPCDPERASACGRLPGAGEGACVCGRSPACPGGLRCVRGEDGFACVDPASDPQNCGGTGQACGAGEFCERGRCVCGLSGVACGPGQTCCDSRCVDLQADASHCGACGNACSAAGPRCVDGACRCGASPPCAAPRAFPASDLGQSCCDDRCVDNTNASCGCGVSCTGRQVCAVDAAGILGEGPPRVCCSLFDAPAGVCPFRSADG